VGGRGGKTLKEGKRGTAPEKTGAVSEGQKKNATRPTILLAKRTRLS